MRRKRAQSTVEYLAVITIILAVFIAIGTYFKRGIQGRWKEAVDGLGDQYDPRVTNADIMERTSGTTQVVVTTIPVNGGIRTLRDDTSDMVETKSGSMRVGAF